MEKEEFTTIFAQIAGLPLSTQEFFAERIRQKLEALGDAKLEKPALPVSTIRPNENKL